jgi:hypothetical protein
LDGDGTYAVDEIRTYTLPGACGLPTGTDAISLNLTVTNTGSQPFGHLKIWPADQAEPNVSTINYPGAGATLANAAIVALSISPVGQLKVKSGLATADVIMDVNGYFSDILGTTANFLELTSSAAGQGTILGRNSSTTTGSSGVYGLASAATGTVFGVFGKSSSTSNNSAGIKGVDSSGELSTVVAAARAGVRGDSSSGVGVSGFSRATAVAGSLLDGSTPANVQAAGYLGYSVGNYGVYALGDIGATGMKFFVEPHPTDASKVIRFVALEGPEAGTYFRGSGRTVGGWATIEVPESFRIVTDGEGLTVQLTPVGDLVQLAVVEKTLNQITLRSSRDVAFDYEVKGVRRAFRNHVAIANGSEFVPASPDARLPESLSQEARYRLIANGTYREDGSVNMTTADRLGWTQQWERRPEDRRPNPASPSP